MSSLPPEPDDISRDVVLRDGSTLHLRGVRADDAAGLRRFLIGLSAESLHARYFRVLKSPDPEVARLLAEAAETGLAMVGTAGDEIVAVATYGRDAARPDHAEVAFAIADALQGRGIATRLLDVLADHARARHIAVFDAYVLGGNERMLRVFADSGFDVAQRLDAGVTHVALTLTATPHYAARAAARSEVAAAASIRHLLAPATTVVVGANRQRGKIGAEILHNLRACGYRGRLFVVHPSEREVDGVPAFARIGDVPGEIDLAVIAVPAAHVLAVVEDCAAKGVKSVVIISAGFSETGAEGRALEATVLDVVRRAGMRLVGPNCMGVLNTDPAVQMNATFSPVYPPVGHVAMSTQSGALGLAILDYARRLHLGLSTFVSVGNKADVSGNDLIQYWAADPQTEVILLYLESFGNPRAFSQIARRVGRRKPIVAVKAGRSAAGARAATSHTGALASRDAIVDALFQQAGVIRTETLEELFDVAVLLAHQPIPRGRRVGILTNAGGPGILAADACEAQGLLLPALSDASAAELRSFLPAAAAVGNPVDMIASASAAQYERALGILLRDERIDSVLVIFIPPLVTKIEDVAGAVRRAAATTPEKPVVGIFMSADGAAPMLGGIPSFMFPEAAAVALARATTYGEWRAAGETHPPVLTGIDETAARTVVDQGLARGGGWLTPQEAQRLLAAAGIAAAASEVVQDEASAVRAAARLGFPVALKAIGPTIVHKTEVRGVALGLADAMSVEQAWRDLTTRLGSAMTGALVQQMVTGGVEMLIGCLDDPVFGPVIACASGGTMAELLGDAQFRLPPLSDRDATDMIRALRGAALLRGHRGAPALDEAALREALLRLSALVMLCPEIAEADLNPILVQEKGVRALDVRVRVERPRLRTPTRRISY